jgi:coenzyme Q-binding protein COQ10
MLALVGDVPNYGKFIQWVKAVRVWDKSNDGKSFSAELMIGYKAIRIPFSTRVNIKSENNIIKTSLLKNNGFSLIPNPLRALECTWKIIPHEQGCEIDLQIDYNFADPFLAALITSNTNKATSRLIEAFSIEADNRYAVT